MSSNQNRREMAMALETPPPIFKLDVDCFEELFDWLSLTDLHAFGQTCKRMQQVAGYYFRSTYPGVKVYCRVHGIHCNRVQINGFCNYIENIIFDFDDGGCFLFARSNEFNSIKKISFRDLTITDENIACVKVILSKAEFVKVYDCDITGDVYNQFLQYCANMKILQFEYCDDFAEISYDWLLQRYPKLEKLVLIHYYCTPILEMKIFFERNPKVQHFATSQEFLWANRHSIFEANVKLDTLAILWGYNDDEDNEFRYLLVELREREVYKRLHLCVRRNNKEDVHQMVPTKTVEKVIYYGPPMYVTSIPFINLKELYLSFIPNGLNMEAVAGSLLNLERIQFGTANLDHIFAFVRRSWKLGHIAVSNLKEMEGNVINLASWNKEREKLARARKVTVYVDGRIFVATKGAKNNKDYRLIGIKRFDSFRLAWNFVWFY